MKYTDEIIQTTGEMVLMLAERSARGEYGTNGVTIPVKLANGMIAYLQILRPAWQQENALEFYVPEVHGEFLSGF